MNIFELFILAIGLSMDAFAVSVTKGMTLKKINLSIATKIAAYVYRRRMVRGISGINAPCGIFWRTILCR